MSISDKFKIWKFDKMRLEAFSDGVFAIIITILVLDVKVPHIDHSTESSEILWDELRQSHIFPVLLSWVISFLIIGTYWLNHHNILRMATKSDYGMVWINTLMLLFTALIPFPAEMMGLYPHNSLAVGSLGIVLLLSGTMLITLYYYVANNYLSEQYDKATVKKNVRKSLIIGPAFYGIAIASAWVNTYITFVIYAIVPLLFIVPLDKPKSMANH